MDKIALLIIYNHRFDKNIPILNKIYENRFSHIYHIVPFYDGEEKNVIPVYESSYRFQGYVSQAYNMLRGKGFTHFFVVADDMMINPSINEKNLWEVTSIPHEHCYIHSFNIFQTKKEHWERTMEALDYDPDIKGVEIRNIIPTNKEAAERFRFHNIPTTPLPFGKLMRNIKKCRTFSLGKKMQILGRMGCFRYPVVGGYSDIFLVTADVMDKFTLYCGAFAATGLFVEVAIPTALALAADKIVFDKDIKLKEKALWTGEDYKFLDKYNFNLQKLVQDYPADTLYIHPIKLSKWK